MSVQTTRPHTKNSCPIRPSMIGWPNGTLNRTTSASSRLRICGESIGTLRSGLISFLPLCDEGYVPEREAVSAHSTEGEHATTDALADSCTRQLSASPSRAKATLAPLP